MGITHTSVAVQPIGNRKKPWKAVFLVDSGASVCVVPRRVLRRLGIKPYRRDRYELADGSMAEFEVGGAILTVKGIPVMQDVAFGPDDCEPILGAPALQAANLVWDARREQLVPAPRLKPLKPLIPPAATR
jgi:clan AA aspartic protease